MTPKSELARLLAPTTVAVVGASEKLGMSNNAVLPMLEAGRDVVLVNPNRDTVYDRPAVGSLADVGRPIDAVLSLVNAARSVEVVEQAAALGCGGVVVAAAGFTEMGEEGAALQRRLVDAARAGGVAVVGPNCSGFKNVPRRVNLFTGGRLDPEPGGLSVVSQSGFLTRSALAAAVDRRLGVAIAVSSGNEAVCDLADHLEVLVDDPDTTVIALVIEKVRRPDAFFAAVARARAEGKPVLALKLGRSERSRDIVRSHTGTIADASWVYDLAFREHGVVSVRDVDELVDAAQLLCQVPRARWRAVDRIGIITTSGGVAALATDIAEDEGAPVPPLEELAPWVRERVPGDTVNPLDLTGFVMSQPEVMAELFERYAGAVDLLALAWWIGEGDEGWSRTLLEPYAAVAASNGTPFVVTPVEATSVGAWVPAWRERGIVTTRGVQSLYRAARAMTAVTRSSARAEREAVQPPAAPAPSGLVGSDVGPIVPFATAMALLNRAGVAVAPWSVLDPAGAVVGGEPDVAALGERLVVKLADVAHRTELGAVALAVAPADVAAVAARMRVIAREAGVPATVAVQAMAAGHGEAFLGLQCRTDLGPVVLAGLGGVLVEVTRQVAGRLLPLDRGTAEQLVDEVAGPEVIGGLRGQRPWPTTPLVDAVLALDLLWRTHGAWLESVDLNPLVVSDGGVVAVDALMVARDPG